jgi:ABC-type dipeptide/oligopeptide/nickel transport system ATPase subunit
LELTDEIMQHAWQERISQLTGSNQNSILQLLQAYQDNRESDALLLKDKENLLSLAKRISVLKHFQQQKQNNQ